MANTATISLPLSDNFGQVCKSEDKNLLAHSFSRFILINKGKDKARELLEETLCIRLVVILKVEFYFIKTFIKVCFPYAVELSSTSIHRV